MVRSLPHGVYSILMFVLAAMGWAFSLWQGDGCNYAIVSGPIVDQLESNPSYNSSSSGQLLLQPPPSHPITTLELGFDSYRELPGPTSIGLNKTTTGSSDNIGISDNNNSSSSSNSSSSNNNNNNNTLSKSFVVTNNATYAEDMDIVQLLQPRKTGCHLYPDEVLNGIVDTSWTTSRSFAFFGLVLGGAGTVFLACGAVCFVFSRATWRWTGYGFWLAATCQGLSLVAFFRTQLCSWNTCNWSLGSVSDVLALGLWALTGSGILCYYPEPISYHYYDNTTPAANATTNTKKTIDDHDDDEEDPRRFPQAEIA